MAELDRYTQKAVDDPNFRARVLKDANKAIKEEFDYEPPYKVTYHISDENHIVFCLPPDDGALDDSFLDNIAGGVGVSNSNNGNVFNNGDLFVNGIFNQTDPNNPQGQNKRPSNIACGYKCF